MALWTLSHTQNANLTRIASALQRLDPTFRLHEATGERYDFRHGKILVRLAEGSSTLQEVVWDARFDDDWKGPHIKPDLEGLIDIIPGNIGESESEIEKIYNHHLPKMKPDEAYERALQKAKDMATTQGGKAGTVVIDPLATTDEERYRVLKEEEVQHALTEMQADETTAMKRADEVQSQDGRLPRPWESSWEAAVAPLTPTQVAIFRILVFAQLEIQEFVIDRRTYNEDSILVAFAPLTHPTWRGDLTDFIESLQIGVVVTPQTALVSPSPALDLVPTACLQDLLDEAEKKISTP